MYATASLAGERKGAFPNTQILTSHPASSATIVGEENGKDTTMPFSVPIHRALWAATMLLIRITTRDRRRSVWKAEEHATHTINSIWEQ